MVSFVQRLFLATSMRKKTNVIAYIARNVSIVVGLVLVWRGIWYVLDALDIALFGGSHLWSGIGGIALGLIILYIPDHDLKEIEKL